MSEDRDGVFVPAEGGESVGRGGRGMEIVLGRWAVLADSPADLDAWAEHMAALAQVTVDPLLRSPLRTMRFAQPKRHRERDIDSGDFGLNREA